MSTRSVPKQRSYLEESLADAQRHTQRKARSAAREGQAATGELIKDIEIGSLSLETITLERKFSTWRAQRIRASGAIDAMAPRESSVDGLHLTLANDSTVAITVDLWVEYA